MSRCSSASDQRSPASPPRSRWRCWSPATVLAFLLLGHLVGALDLGELKRAAVARR